MAPVYTMDDRDLIEDFELPLYTVDNVPPTDFARSTICDGTLRPASRPVAHRRSGAGFWLEWAPIILLGLVAAVSGAWRIGTAVSVAPTPAAYVQMEHRSTGVETAAALSTRQAPTPRQGGAF